jgi:hypothetical protein
MNLACESLLRYQGLNDMDGVCHIRVYEQPGALPIVVAGALDDNPGTSITNAIEMVAAAVQRDVLSDGREFGLIEHYPGALGDPTTQAFSWVRFKHRHTHESPDDPAHNAGTLVILGPDQDAVSHSNPIEGDFRDPKWEPIESIEQALGCEIATWPQDQYTAHAVAGERGQQLLAEVGEDAKAAAGRLIDTIEANT